MAFMNQEKKVDKPELPEAQKPEAPEMKASVQDVNYKAPARDTIINAVSNLVTDIDMIISRLEALKGQLK